MPLSPGAYKQAFDAISPIPPSYLDILRFHYHQPERTISASQAARAIGFKNYNAVNLHYGRMGRLVGERLGLEPDMPLGVLVTFDKPSREWHWIMKPQVAAALESLGWVDTDIVFLPGEMHEKTQLSEGAVCRIAVAAYERNREARNRCIEHYGPRCAVCGFDFGETYGNFASGFIHVHHLRPLAEIGRDYEVDPVADLRPVCPNCHAVLHLQTPPYTVEEMRRLIRRRVNRSA